MDGWVWIEEVEAPEVTGEVRESEKSSSFSGLLASLSNCDHVLCCRSILSTLNLIYWKLNKANKLPNIEFIYFSMYYIDMQIISTNILYCSLTTPPRCV